MKVRYQKSANRITFVQTKILSKSGEKLTSRNWFVGVGGKNQEI